MEKEDSDGQVPEADLPLSKELNGTKSLCLIPHKAVAETPKYEALISCEHKIGWICCGDSSGVSPRPEKLVKVENHEPEMGGPERTQNVGGEPCMYLTSVI